MVLTFDLSNGPHAARMPWLLAGWGACRSRRF